MPTRRRSKIETILFTDIEGSTRQGELTPAAMGVAVGHHNNILSEAIAVNQGEVLKTIGDSFQASFDDPGAALVAAVSVQRALTAEPWEQLGVSDVRVRMALHTGSLTWDKTKRDYEWAPMLNHVARLMAAANGGQILLSRATAELVRGALPEGISLHDHGEHRLQRYQTAHAGISGASRRFTN